MEKCSFISNVAYFVNGNTSPNKNNTYTLNPIIKIKCCTKEEKRMGIWITSAKFVLLKCCAWLLQSTHKWSRKKSTILNCVKKNTINHIKYFYLFIVLFCFLSCCSQLQGSSYCIEQGLEKLPLTRSHPYLPWHYCVLSVRVTHALPG